MTPNEERHQSDFDDVFDYLEYSRVREVNVIPEVDFKRLVSEVFHSISENLRKTYGPYGRQVMIQEMNESITTKDGYNTFCAMGFSNPYKNRVYQNIRQICERVNRVVGDGTTSCILLEDKMFNKINAIIETPDDMRNALFAFNEIERDYQSLDKLERDKKCGVIKPLTVDALTNLINLADNYDFELADVLIKGFKPTVEDGVVTNVRNLIVDKTVDPEASTNIHYELKELPGEYRVRVEMNPDVALSFENWSHVKMAVFDHVFTENDWFKFYKEYDKETSPETVIIATGFSKKFLDAIYATQYCFYECEKNEKPIKIKLAIIRGQFVQKEVSDLCAMIGTDKIKIETPIIDHSNLPTVDMCVFDQNCMCFKNLTVPTEYIQTVKEDMRRDDSKSYILKKNYLDRIDAMMLRGSGDTSLKITGSTALEVELVADKITDCTSIVKSAVEYGIVPNMLKYGWIRTGDKVFPNENVKSKLSKDRFKDMCGKIEQAIRESIEGLFADVWRSKYLTTRDEDGLKAIDEFYNKTSFDFSYDIIEEETTPVYEFPTSPQYDLEVIVAAVSIVKYLITSGAYIFDSNLLGRSPQQTL